MTNELENRLRSHYVSQASRLQLDDVDVDSLFEPGASQQIHGYHQQTTARRTPWVLAAAAIIAVAGVAGTVAIANRSSGPSTVGAADEIEQTDTSVPTVTPTTSRTALDETGTATARLLYPIAAEMDVSGAVSVASVDATVTGTDSTWIAHATAFVTPEGHVVSAQEQSRAFDAVPAELPKRTVGDNVFHLGNEDGNRIYFATGACRTVAVLPGSETSKSEPWSNDALELMATVDLTSPDRWVTTPKDWTQIEGGFAELIYDVSFTVNNSSRGLNGTNAHLRQAFAPLGFLVGASVGMARAEQVTMTDLPQGTSDQAWLLTNSDGLQYLGWTTTFGSALLYLEGDDSLASGEFPGVALETGHGDLWAAGLNATAQASDMITGTTITEGSVTSYPEGIVNSTAQMTEQSTTSYPEGVTPTTSQIAVSTTPASCRTPENG